MKKTLMKDYINKTREELTALVAKEIAEAEKQKLYNHVKKNKNVREIYIKKKNIAVLKTIIREKELTNG